MKILQLGRVAWCVKELHSEFWGFRFKFHQVLDWALGPNLVTRHPLTFGQNKLIAGINIKLVKLQSSPWGSQIAVKKNSYASWSPRFISPKLCVGLSIFDVQQKAWTLWLQISIIPSKIKIIKPHTVLLPEL